MEKNEAYNLYHYGVRFREEIKEKGFISERNTHKGADVGHYHIKKQIDSPKRRHSKILYVGEIINDRFLIIFTSPHKKRSRRDNKEVSKLQKLARGFFIP